MSSQPTQESGFSLIELLVVIGISVLMTTLLLINMRTGTDHVELEGEAYKIATLAREAQTYAISTKTFGATLTYKSVGLYFNNVPNGTMVTFFGERTPDGIFNTGDDDITSKKLTLMSGYKIISICGNAASCPSATLNNVSVAYQRPFVSASIMSGATKYSYITITLQSPKQNTRQIQLWSTGQVTVL